MTSAANVTEPGGGAQDPCSPTETWAGSFRLDERQLGGDLVAGDVLPTPFGGPLARGAFQARMSSSGSALQAGAIVGLLDLAATEEQTGTPPAEACEELAAATADGASPCVPCEDPADAAGLPICVGVVWEFSLAPAAGAPLVDVAVDALPPECSDG